MCIEYTGKLSRLEKGQVWFVEEPEEVTKAMKKHGEKVTVGTRPYLIISVGETNSDKGTISCIPITTNCDPVSSLLSQRDIVAKTPDGLKVRFLVDQITCKTAANFRDFKYSIPVDLMKGIEFQIQSRLGLDTTENSIFEISKKFWKPDPVKPKIEEMQIKNSETVRSLPIKTEDQALQFIVELEKLGYSEYSRVHKCSTTALYQRVAKIRKKYGIQPRFK